MSEARPGTAPGMDDRPLAELLRDLSTQTSTLVRKEIELARAELTAKGRRAGAGAGMFGAAGLLGVLALAAVTAGAIMLLGTAIAPWLAAVVVAAAYGLVAGVLALTGKKAVDNATPPIPEAAAESVKEDVEWAKARARAARQ